MTSSADEIAEIAEIRTLAIQLVIPQFDSLVWAIWYDVRIHTYIHTYRQTPLAFNTLMLGLLRLTQLTELSQL